MIWQMELKAALIWWQESLKVPWTEMWTGPKSPGRWVTCEHPSRPDTIRIFQDVCGKIKRRHLSQALKGQRDKLLHSSCTDGRSVFTGWTYSGRTYASQEHVTETQFKLKILNISGLNVQTNAQRNPGGWAGRLTCLAWRISICCASVPPALRPSRLWSARSSSLPSDPAHTHRGSSIRHTQTCRSSNQRKHKAL